MLIRIKIKYLVERASLRKLGKSCFSKDIQAINQFFPSKNRRRRLDNVVIIWAVWDLKICIYKYCSFDRYSTKLQQLVVTRYVEKLEH